jgi:hypothetical protein
MLRVRVRVTTKCTCTVAMARTFCDAADDVDAHSPVQEQLALAVEVALEGAAGHELVHEEALGSAFGAAEP